LQGKCSVLHKKNNNIHTFTLTEIVKKYYSKVLLFGEYTVTMGYGGMAIPYHGFSGFWDFGDASPEEKDGINRLYNHVVVEDDLCQRFNLSQFKREIENGIFFHSDIPQGYGLGSSGALVAGFYDRYAVKKTSDNLELIQILSKVEGAFHGSSSGIDPLISALNTPLHIGQNGEIEMCPISLPKARIFLINTGKSRSTDHLVKAFKNKWMNDSDFKIKMKDLGSLNQEAIKALKSRDDINLYSKFGKISQIQFDFLKEMIPDDFFNLWDEGIKSGQYYVKLCGAGGGGMMLTMLKTSNTIPDMLEGYVINELK
jgi:mevalonate kinase